MFIKTRRFYTIFYAELLLLDSIPYYYTNITMKYLKFLYNIVAFSYKVSKSCPYKYEAFTPFFLSIHSMLTQITTMFLVHNFYFEVYIQSIIQKGK